MIEMIIEVIFLQALCCSHISHRTAYMDNGNDRSCHKIHPDFCGIVSYTAWSAKSDVDFYKKCVCTVMIDEKSSGVYKRMIDIEE